MNNVFEEKDKISYINLPVCRLCGENVNTLIKDSPGIETLWCKKCNVYFYLTLERCTHNGIQMIATRFEPKDQQTKTPPVSFQSTPKSPFESILNRFTAKRSYKSEQNDKQHNSSENSSKASNKKKNVRGQILVILKELNRIVEFQEFVQRIDASKQSITEALTKLIADKLVERTSFGHYDMSSQNKKDKKDGNARV